MMKKNGQSIKSNNPFLTLKNLLIENFKKDHTKEEVNSKTFQTLLKNILFKKINLKGEHLRFLVIQNIKLQVGYYYMMMNMDFQILHINVKDDKLYIGINNTMSKYNYDLKLHDLGIK